MYEASANYAFAKICGSYFYVNGLAYEREVGGARPRRGVSVCDEACC